jgi:uncharacterized protein YdhG (YjbR/CyaY superfamily)
MATKKPAKSTTAKADKYEGFSEEERAAMKERAKELKGAGRGANAESELLAKIAEMPDSDRVIAERLHAIVKANAPSLTPRLYYGMPAWALNGKVLCHFQPAQKFKTRYPTFAFTDVANIDEGAMFPTAFGVAKLTAAEEKKIAALVKKAVS